jgi:hypothetical protein
MLKNCATDENTQLLNKPEMTRVQNELAFQKLGSKFVHIASRWSGEGVVKR